MILLFQGKLLCTFVEFGNRDHSTVMHGYNKIVKEIKEKNSTKLIVESVQNIITSEKNK